MLKQSSFKAGDEIPSLRLEKITRSMLSSYANASGDLNPIHIDPVFARKAGLKDVIAHGMLVMAYLARTLTDVFPHSSLVSFSSQFISMTLIGDRLTCFGTIVKKNIDEKNSVTLEISMNGYISLEAKSRTVFIKERCSSVNCMLKTLLLG